mgnify:CR=1 FL=1
MGFLLSIEPALGVLVAGAVLAVAFTFLQKQQRFAADTVLGLLAHSALALGLVALGFMWAQMAKIAKAKLAEGTDDPDFYKTKLVTARFFFERMIPDVSSLLVKMSAGSKTMMALDAEAF